MSGLRASSLLIDNTISVEVPEVLACFSDIFSEYCLCFRLEANRFSYIDGGVASFETNERKIDISIFIGDKEWTSFTERILTIGLCSVIVLENDSEVILFCNVRKDKYAFCGLGDADILRFWIAISIVVPKIRHDNTIFISCSICRYIDDDFLTLFLAGSIDSGADRGYFWIEIAYIEIGLG